MRVQVLGVGDTFSPSLGNPSFIIWDNAKGFLINCGFTVFPALKEKNLLKLVDKVFLNSHLGHHAGSFDTFLYYQKQIANQKITFYGISEHLEYLKRLDPDFVNNSESYFNLSKDSINTVQTQYKEDVYSEALLYKKIIISGDTKESLLDTSYARDAKIIFHEVTFESSDSSHTTFVNLARAADEVKRKTWLYQYKPKDNIRNESKVRNHGFAGFLEKDQNIEF